MMDKKKELQEEIERLEKEYAAGAGKAGTRQEDRAITSTNVSKKPARN